MSKSKFDKICVFCDKCCICSDKCVFIVVKIKGVNSDNISDICDKLNFTTNYTYFTTIDTILKHIQKLQFFTPSTDGPAVGPKYFRVNGGKSEHTLFFS